MTTINNYLEYIIDMLDAFLDAFAQSTPNIVLSLLENNTCVESFPLTWY